MNKKYINKIKKKIIKSYMKHFSRVGQVDPRWEGYVRANNATTDREKEEALLEISETRYRESIIDGLERYFGRIDLKSVLEGKDVLETGSNHGGAALAYLEKYKLNSITGIDTSETQAGISNLFFERKGVQAKYHFQKAFAENLPFDDESFDAIISFDVFEHVADLRKVMDECYRVLRPGGMVLTAFPSFYQPVAHHLLVVTGAPCIHWFFKPDDLMEVYWDILDENPEYRDSKGLKRRPLRPWEKLFIINGTTLRGFRKIISHQPWSDRRHVRLPLGSVGSFAGKHPLLRVMKYVFWLGTKLPVLEEVTNHRIAFILTK